MADSGWQMAKNERRIAKKMFLRLNLISHNRYNGKYANQGAERALSNVSGSKSTGMDGWTKAA